MNYPNHLEKFDWKFTNATVFMSRLYSVYKSIYFATSVSTCSTKALSNILAKHGVRHIHVIVIVSYRQSCEVRASHATQSTEAAEYATDGGSRIM